MYAVVDIKGFQYKLEKGDTLRVPKFNLEVGKKIKLEEVLLISDNGKVSIGTPIVDGAVVSATITDEGKDKKIIIFKKKRRKDYSVKNGHRQQFTEITIDDIKVKSVTKAAEPKAEEKTTEPKKVEKKVAEPKAEAKVAEPKKVEKKAAAPKAEKKTEAKADKE